MNVNDIRQTPPQMTILKQSQKRAAGTPFDAQIKQTPGEEKNAKMIEHPHQQPAALTTSEKDYFEQLYPSSIDEVRTYNPYQRGGAQTTVRLGTHFDRKG